MINSQSKAKMCWLNAELLFASVTRHEAIKAYAIIPINKMVYIELHNVLH